MKLNIRDFYYRESVGQDEDMIEIMSDDKVAYDIDIHKTYWGNLTVKELKESIILDLINLKILLEDELDRRNDMDSIRKY